jgi:hypothetical protein
VAGLDPLAHAGAGIQPEVEEQGRGGQALDRAGHGLAVAAVEGAGDHPHASAVDLLLGDLLGLDVAVAGGLHLLAGRQVDPELEAVQAAALLQRHLGVDDAAPGGHPLGAAAAQVAGVAQVVLVLEIAFQHVGDGLEAPVRVGREAGDVVVRVVRGELVEHQEGSRRSPWLLAEAAPQLDAGPVGDGDGRDDPERLRVVMMVSGFRR